MGRKDTETIVLGVIGDLHGELYNLSKVLEHLRRVRLDGVLLTGDFASPRYDQLRWGGRPSTPILIQEIERVLELIQKLDIPAVWVPGNHDELDLDLPGNCDRKVVEVADLRIFGIGGSGPGKFGFPYEWSDDELRELEVPACEVILSHAPPARTPLDRMYHTQMHVGSEVLREIAEAHDGAFVCGHIHEGVGALKLGRSMCLNAGSLGDPYGSIQMGFLTFDRKRRCLAVRHENLLSGRSQEVRRASPDSEIPI